MTPQLERGYDINITHGPSTCVGCTNMANSSAGAVPEEEDPYESAIERSGCARHHHTLQDCYLEHGDWRKCQREMQEFKKCVDEQNKRKQRTN